MSYQSTQAAEFCSTIEGWLRVGGEVSALIRFSHAGGSKSFELFDSIEAFQVRLQRLPPRTCVIVFRERQLPFRGRVDEDFVRTATSHIPEGAEYLIAGLDEVSSGSARWFRFLAGEGHAQLEKDLKGCFAERVAVGNYPPWLEDSDVVFSAVVPDEDGAVGTGVY